jgi:protein-tyrosine phosphatase
MASSQGTAKVHAVGLLKGPGRVINVLMVCLGNICRSPTAQGVLEKLVFDRGLEKAISVDSAGTADYHVGKNPDPRSIAAASQRGFDLSSQVSRQVSDQDFEKFDYILAMDVENLTVLQARCPLEHRVKLKLLLSFTEQKRLSVPDPYYGDDGFELVLDLLEQACHQFLTHIAYESSSK